MDVFKLINYVPDHEALNSISSIIPERGKAQKSKFVRISKEKGEITNKYTIRIGYVHTTLMIKIGLVL